MKYAKKKDETAERRTDGKKCHLTSSQKRMREPQGPSLIISSMRSRAKTNSNPDNELK